MVGSLVAVVSFWLGTSLFKNPGSAPTCMAGWGIPLTLSPPLVSATTTSAFYNHFLLNLCFEMSFFRLEAYDRNFKLSALLWWCPTPDSNWFLRLWSMASIDTEWCSPTPLPTKNKHYAFFFQNRKNEARDANPQMFHDGPRTP